jgi:hypothetical protein
MFEAEVVPEVDNFLVRREKMTLCALDAFGQLHHFDV